MSIYRIILLKLHEVVSQSYFFDKRV